MAYHALVEDIPVSMREDHAFLSELASFLVHMCSNTFEDANPTSKKAGAEFREERDTTDPHYITELFAGILRGVGNTAPVPRITKRVADEVRWHSSRIPWRRSPLWLLIRVAIQTTLHVEGDNHLEYKSFMAFLVAKVLRLAVDSELPSDLIHIMHTKLARRIFKLEGVLSPALDATLDKAGNAAKALRSERWKAIQKQQADSRPWAPETLNILADTRLTLKNSRGYLDSVLAGDTHHNVLPGFQPSEQERCLPGYYTQMGFGTGASHLKLAISAEKYIGLRDFEESVSQFLNDWVTQQLQLSHTCTKQIDSLVELFGAYHNAAAEAYLSNVEDQSIMLLTLLDIWMGVDRFATSEIPLMLDYVPEVPPNLLQSLLLRSSSSTDQAIRIVNHCNKRTQRAAHGSVFSTAISKYYIGVQFFRSSRELLALKRQIERDAEEARTRKCVELDELNSEYHELRAKAGKSDLILTKMVLELISTG